QRQPVSRAPDIGEPKHIGAGALDRPISDRALAEFGDAGRALPSEHGLHGAAVERAVQPIFGPLPILREQSVMVHQHLMRFDVRDAETRRQRRRLHPVLRAETQNFQSVTDRLDAWRLACGVWCYLTDDLSEKQIRIAAAV